MEMEVETVISTPARAPGDDAIAAASALSERFQSDSEKGKSGFFSRVASSVKRSPGASPRVPESPVTLGSPGDGGVGSKTRMMDALSLRARWTHVAVAVDAGSNEQSGETERAVDDAGERG